MIRIDERGEGTYGKKTGELLLHLFEDECKYNLQNLTSRKREATFHSELHQGSKRSCASKLRLLGKECERLSE